MAEVVSLRGAGEQTDAKSEFLRYIAQSFDHYVKCRRAEPDALIITWCGVRQDATTGWLVRGDSEGSVTTVQALALASLTKAIVNPEPSDG